MRKYVVTTFPTETQAYEGLAALSALDAEGSLNLYATCVIAKDPAGTPSVKQEADPGPLGVGVGALVGTLAGLLGGPVGVAAGMATGAVIGGAGDLVNSGVSSSFVEEVARRLTPGTTALVAEVDEEWIAPLDARMAAIGAGVLREARADVADAQNAARIEAYKAELAELKAEFAQANHQARERIRSRMAELRTSLQAAASTTQARIEARQQQTRAKIDALSERAHNAQADARATMDRRVADLRVESARRKAKLAEAHELAQEARGLTREALAP